MKRTIVKNYSVIVPGSKPVIIRQTTTLAHSVKHAAYCSQLRIRVIVRDNVTQVTVLELPAIDRNHAEKPKNKRDKQYLKLARKAKG